MPFCPECEYRYPDGIAMCPDCASPLVDTLAKETSFICDECKEPVAADASWCGNCGTVFVETLCCMLHPETPAHGRCVACGQHVCPECAVKQLRRFFCPDDSQMEQQPARRKAADSSVQDWEAVLYGRHLSQSGISSRLFSQQQDYHRLRAFMDTTGIKLVAPFTAKRAVAEVLKERDINQEVVLFECDHCSAISRMKDLICPNCGK